MPDAPLKKILYVEDVDDIRVIGEIAIGMNKSWEVISSSSGTDALQKASELLPDLIILDAMMPGMDGLSTMRALKSQDITKNIPVIFMTSKIQREEKAQYLAEGAIGVISKPFEPMGLAKEVQQIFEAAGRQ
ncbi:MAG: response regulator [Myxococcota bacterium]